VDTIFNALYKLQKLILCTYPVYLLPRLVILCALKCCYLSTLLHITSYANTHILLIYEVLQIIRASWRSCYPWYCKQSSEMEWSKYKGFNEHILETGWCMLVH